MRLFIAIELSAPVRGALLNTISSLSQHSRGLWTRRENLHLTLEFLGEQPGIGEASAAMDALSDVPFELTLSGLGRFRGRDGDLVWYGVRPCPPLLALQSQLHDELSVRGFRLEARAYKPHLTLGRQVTGAGELSRYDAPQLTQRVESIALMESHRVDGVLTYTARYRKNLNTKESYR